MTDHWRLWLGVVFSSKLSVTILDEVLLDSVSNILATDYTVKRKGIRDFLIAASDIVVGW